jgi:hypothetical protein
VGRFQLGCPFQRRLRLLPQTSQQANESPSTNARGCLRKYICLLSPPSSSIVPSETSRLHPSETFTKYLLSSLFLPFLPFLPSKATQIVKMSGVMTSLVRRGFEAVGDGNKPPVVSVDLPTWGAFLLATTFAAFFFVIFMVRLRNMP